jgi:hypothetical protein
MLLTFPMPFFTCRELFLVYWQMLGDDEVDGLQDPGGEGQLIDVEEDLLGEQLLPADKDKGMSRLDIGLYLSTDKHNASGGLQLQTK